MKRLQLLSTPNDLPNISSLDNGLRICVNTSKGDMHCIAIDGNWFEYQDESDLADVAFKEQSYEGSIASELPGEWIDLGLFRINDDGKIVPEDVD